MSLKIIDRNIRSITGSITKLNDMIHSTALLILDHAAEHGDCTRALVLVKAMPASFRRAMLVDWFTRNTPIRVNVHNDKVGMLKDGARGYVPFNRDAAAAVPFYVEQTKANDDDGEKTYDVAAFDSAFARLIAKAEKELADGRVAEPSVDGITKRLAALSAMLKVNEATKANVEFVMPANVAPLNPRARAAA